MAQTYLERLDKVTFSVHHNPNCPSPYQVRLVGKNASRIDNKYKIFTKDIIGFGKSMEEAAKDAWIKKFD